MDLKLKVDTDCQLQTIINVFLNAGYTVSVESSMEGYILHCHLNPLDIKS